MVPTYDQKKYSEVGASFEYAVSYFKVENIVIMGHSCCSGIRGLMSLPDDGATFSYFIEQWVKIGLSAKSKVKAQYSNLSHDEQCAHWENEYANVSLGNLFTYPFVRDTVISKNLAIQ